MARRKDHSRDEIKQMALAAAMAILQEQGSAELSARAIARRIGYTVGTLYNIFSDYNDIILQVNAITLDEMQNTLAGDENIYVLTQRYIQFAHRHAERWRLMFETRLSDPHLPDWYSKKIDALFARVEQSLLPEVGNSPTIAKLAAKVLWAGLYGICLLSINGKLDLILGETAQNLGQSFVENYLSGLMKKS